MILKFRYIERIFSSLVKVFLTKTNHVWSNETATTSKAHV